MDTKQKFRLAIPAVVIALVVVTALVATILISAGQGTAVAENQTEIATPADYPDCDFENLKGLTSAEAEAQLKPLDRPIRVLGPNQPATMDYSLGRINLLTDDSGVVQSVNCG